MPIDLPNLIQSLAQQALDGVLFVEGDRADPALRIGFAHGAVTGVSETGHPLLAEAFQWLGLCDDDFFADQDLTQALAESDEALCRIVRDRELLSMDAIRDAIDSCIEERFSACFDVASPRMRFEPNADPDAWLTLQAELGTRLNANSLLMESLRRQDEMGRFGDLNLAADDFLIVDTKHMRSESLDQYEMHLLKHWNNEQTMRENTNRAAMNPWLGRKTCSGLALRKILRPANVSELVVIGQHAHSSAAWRRCELALRQAVAQGAGTSRIFMTLAEIAERRGAIQQAAHDFLAAASVLQENDPANTVFSLRSALRLGANKERCLKDLLTIYQDLDEHDDALDVLFELAGYYETRGDIELAMQCVRDAQLAGGDDLRCSQVLAELALLAKDHEQAIIQFDSAARLAEERGQAEQAIAFSQRILALQPGNCEHAISYARALHVDNRDEEAKAVIDAAMEHLGAETGEDLRIALHECLSEIDPDNSENLDWLAQVYQHRKDRVGATEQLRLLAENFERNGQLDKLNETLTRIIELDATQADMLIKQANTQHALGLNTASSDTWCNTIRLGIESGHLKKSQEWCIRALSQHPGHHRLHAYRAQLAQRQNDNELAIDHFRRAALLAHGCGRYGDAIDALNQLLAIQPNDLFARGQLADCLIATGDDDADETLHTLVHLAVQSNNHGIAIERARQRINQQTPPAWPARSELVELLRKANMRQEELRVGRKLVHEMILEGEFTAALEILLRLVASFNQNAELVIQLAELYEGLSDRRQALRYYRHAVALLQQDNATDEIIDILGRMLPLSKQSENVKRALEMAKAGQPIDWDAIRDERAHASKKAIAGSSGAAD